MQVKALNLGLRIVEVPVSGGIDRDDVPILDKARATGRMLAQIVRHSTSK
jgi:hypothetical protein